MSHVFISYDHTDTGYAHTLADALQARGFEVWIGERLDYGAQWPVEIQKQLDACGAFILVMSPRAFTSEWVQSELQRAKRKLKPIFPILLEGDEPWLSVESTQYYDVRDGSLPDERFYSAIERVVSRNKEEGGVIQPSPEVKRSSRKSASGAPRIRTELWIAIIGAIATVLAAVIPLIWSSLSQNPSPLPPADETTETENAPATEPPLEPSIDPNDFTDSMGVEMRLVPAGEFTMGVSAQSALEDCQKYQSDCQLDWFTDEEPVREVYLDAYYMDLYEVTNASYRACVEAGECLEPTNTGSATRADYFYEAEFNFYPVIHVDWTMAQTYCEWRGARLPTEAEWEKAARGNDGRTYPWGEGIDPSLANYADSGFGDTVEAGDYGDGASPYGILDMAGNVWEWVMDWYNSSYYQFSLLSNPFGPDSGEFHVLRGGSWADTGNLLRASVRGRDDPEVIQDRGFGFRCVLPVP